MDGAYDDDQARPSNQVALKDRGKDMKKSSRGRSHLPVLGGVGV